MASYSFKPTGSKVTTVWLSLLVAGFHYMTRDTLCKEFKLHQHTGIQFQTRGPNIFTAGLSIFRRTGEYDDFKHDHLCTVYKLSNSCACAGCVGWYLLTHKKSILVKKNSRWQHAGIDTPLPLGSGQSAIATHRQPTDWMLFWFKQPPHRSWKQSDGQRILILD